MYCTSSAQETARDAVQIFGGRGITRTGMGRFVEHVRTFPLIFHPRPYGPLLFYASQKLTFICTVRALQYHRTVGFDSLLGGAEDVLGDLGVRQAMRSMPKNARL